MEPEGRHPITCDVARWAARDPRRIALNTPEGSITYAGWHARIAAAQAALAHGGVTRDDRIALCIDDPVLCLTTLLALFRLHAIACPVNPAFPAAYRAERLDCLDPALLIASGPCDAPSGCRALDANTLGTAARSGSAGHTLDTHWDTRAPAAMVFTSGSSGAPKAAVLTLDNLRTNAEGSNRNIPLNEGDSWLLSLPLHHVAGLGILFRCIHAGAAIAIPGRDESVARAIRRIGATHVSLVARQLARLLDGAGDATALDAAKAILLGGGAIPDALLDAARARKLPVFKSYGMTEMASQVTTTRPDAGEAELRSAGRPLLPQSVRVNREGRIEVNGPCRFLGFWDGQKIHAPVDGEGWYETGDLGRFDTAGNLHITGRADNMFVSGGENVQPETIERALCALRGIVQACVVPVPHPEFGATPVAFVDDTQKRGGDEIRAALGEALPAYQIPRHVFPWPHLENQTAMKVPRSHFVAEAKRLLDRA